MRYFLIAFLAFPAFAQAPGYRDISFQCDDTHCILSKEDWKWMMESTLKKDQLLAKCGWKNS